MSRHTAHPAPPDAAARRAAKPVVVYAADRLPPFDAAFYERARDGMTKVSEVIVAAARRRSFRVPAGHLFRIVSIEGPQVGDLNLWNATICRNAFQRQDAGAARHACHGWRSAVEHVAWLRPMATITDDTLGWYGFDADGAGIHDVIGTRCDPYTKRLLTGRDYHYCCHSNLTRALPRRASNAARGRGAPVHDVLNVFMCTGFTRDTHQYFMKASPVRPATSSSSLPRSICSARSRPARAAIAVRATRMIRRAAIRCGRRSGGPARRRWPDGGRRKSAPT